MASEYQQMRDGQAPPRLGRGTLAPEVAKARATERNRRHLEARRRAHAVLAARHADEFKTLLAGERAALLEERGPLPGDPS